ncbi:MAG: DEAD/DEAH box helicase family protein [Dysgonamonadaceae bacterium]|nr:DEAD/DEAH box helicase family protein [Dysgonamonadaceae bacterium]
MSENKRLKEALGVPAKEAKKPEIQFVEEVITVGITKYSPPDEKIALFMSLFRGRSDVYAKRCYSRQYDSAYYIPACKNEWKKGVCNRPKVKCKNCKNRELLPLTNEVINSHLRNKDEHGHGIAGIYPLLKDDACYFLAIDFDKADWQKDVTVFRSVCNTLKIPVAFERSRSGNGAHVWFFFDEAIPAVSARRFGNALLTKAMASRHEIGFDSYDRMFPNQDFMPNGGFGNLIALPLQGGARLNGNSEFVDDNFVTYADQWAYLANIHKFTKSEIEKYLSDWCVGNGLGELQTLENESEENEKPWERKRQEKRLESNDFPSQLTVVESNRLYIPKNGVSQRALNRIKRLAAFSNPLFYKIQRMRMSTYGIPRIIFSLDETADYLGIPRGCSDALVDLLNKLDMSYIFEDKRNTGKQINVDFAGTLRDEQQAAADALLEHENGVLSLPTAFGKTVIGASLIAKHKCNTLILVHLQTLLNQWKKFLEQFLLIDETLSEAARKRGRKKQKSIIGQIGAGKNTASGIIDIAIVQSLIHENEVDEIVKKYGMVIVDECHHVPSVNYEKVLSTVNARYVYGLTATPARQDGLHPITFMQCGAIRYAVDSKTQAAKRAFEHYLIPCFTGFKKPFSVDETQWHITQIYKDITNDEFRNNKIVSDAVDAVNACRTPIILTQRKEHVARLSELLKNQTNAQIIILTGTASAKQKAKNMEQLANFPTHKQLIIVATGKYVGEGFDCQRLDTLLLASPIAWKGTLAQYAGRLHRDYPTKKDVMIYDYVDVHVPVLERMYHKRLAGYSQLGYRSLSAHNQIEKTCLIYDAKSFVPVVKNDFAETKNEILIVSPYLRKKRIEEILEEWLKPAVQADVSITVITRPPESYKEPKPINDCINILQSVVSVIQKPNIHQKFIIIDGRIVWYGNINLLSFGGSEENIMRLESRELAAELAEIIQ